MTTLYELQEKPREKRTPLEQCIVDAVALEDMRDGDTELQEKATADLVIAREQLLDRAKEAHSAHVTLGSIGYATTHQGKFEQCPSPPCVYTRNTLVALGGVR